MTVILPFLSAGSAGGSYSAAIVNAAITQQRTNSQNLLNGVQGFYAQKWLNDTASIASDVLDLATKPRALVIDTEAAASTDNLSTISNGSAYQQLWLKAANAGRVITVKHNVGNIKLNGQGDVTLSASSWLLLFYDGSNWSDTASPTVPPTISFIANTPRTVLGSNAANITISSIPATYQHLMLILELRSAAAGNLEHAYLRFNGDSTAANYYTQYINASGSTASSFEALGSIAGILIDNCIAGTPAPAGNGHAVIFIKNYASATMRRTITYHAYAHTTNSTGGLVHASGGGDWTNAAAAISSITVVTQGGNNILANSAYTLYGLN